MQGPQGQGGRIAVLGLSCRLPGAGDRWAFAETLFAGRDCLGPIPPDRWDRTRHPAVARAGLLDRVDLFDNSYFGITPREARWMDPQQRLLLEETVHCLEDAGLPAPVLSAGRTAVFAAVMAVDYHQNVTAAGTTPDGYAALGSYASLLANRLSHVFGLSGESVTVDAACASSLLALHQARRALLAGECDYALVAAASLIINPWKHDGFAHARMLSPDGRCATFDVGANGYAPGEGVVVLLLRRLEDALAARQPVQGVLLGSAAMHVGGAASITAPSIAAERAVIEAAAATAGIGLATVGYVEAHGTGTALGDPIEMDALEQAFAAAGAAPGSAQVGSVKTNIGHLEGAAGLAGVAKVLLMMRARRIPPTLHLAEPNPLIDFAAGVFRPALREVAWDPNPGSGGRLRAGVSSFGFGGAVAHVILEDAPGCGAAPKQDTPPAFAAPVPVLLSAHTPTAFAALWRQWRAFAATDAFAALPLADVAGTLARGRPHLKYRAALLVADARGLRGALAEEWAAVPAESPVLVAYVGPGSAAMVAALRAAGVTPAWVERTADTSGDVAACSVGWAPERVIPANGAMASRGAIDRAGLDRLRARLAPPEVGELAALLARARALERSNYTFQSYLADWQRVVDNRAALADWLHAPPADADGQALLLLVLLAALRKLQDKWALPSRHAGLGAGWHEAAALLAAGTLPQVAVLALAHGEGLDALASAIARSAPVADIVLALDVDRPPPEGATLLRLGAQDGPDALMRVLVALWLRGVTVDWTGVAGAHRTVPLPLYPFEGVRHWHTLKPAEAAAAEPADRGHEAVSDGDLAREHVIGGRMLVPAASMILAMAEQANSRSLLHLAFLRPVEAAQAPRLQPVMDGRGLSLTLDGQPVCVAETSATASGMRAFPGPPLGPATIAADVVYGRLAGRFHVYGPKLRVIDAAWANDALVVCRLRSTSGAMSPAVLIDGLLQACLVAADHWGMLPAGPGPVYPASCEQLAILSAAPQAGWAAIRRDACSPGPNGFTANGTLATLEGQVWLTMDGVRFAATRTGVPLPSSAPAAAVPFQMPGDAPDPLAVICEAAAAAVEVDVAEIDPDASFPELGVDSLVGAAVAKAIAARLGQPVSLHMLADHGSPRALAGRLASDLPAPTPSPAPPAVAAATSPDLLGVVVAAVAEAVEVDASQIDPAASFAELGVDSIAAADVAQSIGQALGRGLPIHALTDHSTPLALAGHLATMAVPAAARPFVAPVPPAASADAAMRAPEATISAGPPEPAPQRDRAVAIIGMAGRFPGAPDLDAYWSMLLHGRSAIGEVPAGRWTEAEWQCFVGRKPSAAPGGYLEDADCFDAAFFGLSAREALAMDPQQRVLLEESYKALADAGLAGGVGGRIAGVYVGASTGDYPQKWALTGSKPDRPALAGTLGSSLAARISHAFDFAGPALVVDAACASAVAAIQMACDALLRGEVDLALVGAVTVMSTPSILGMASAAGLLSTAGACRPLSAAADGMLLGEAAGVLVLQRAADAAAVGTRPHALIRAAVMGHDGARLGFSTPGARGQARLHRAALARAGLDAADVDCIEAHGVGTPGGDEAELAAFAEVFCDRPVPIGSVKGSIGHGQAAAGLSSLFKAVLQMRHATLVPTLVGEGAAVAKGAEQLVTAPRPLPPRADGQPCRTLVNVFAVNGSNGSLVLEQPGARPTPAAPEGTQLILLGAKTEAALRARMRQFARWLPSHEMPLASLAAAFAAEPAMPWRAAAIAASATELAVLLRDAEAGAGKPGAVRIGQVQRREAEASAVLTGVVRQLLDPAAPAGSLSAAAELLVGGIDVAWPVAAGVARATGLPPYPLERVRHWPEGADVAVAPPPAAPPPPEPLAADPAERLRGCVAKVLDVPADELAMDAPLLALGLDSLLALDLRHAAATALGIDLPVRAWLEAPSLHSLAARLPEAMTVAAPTITLDPAAANAPFPLTDMQSAYLAGRSRHLVLGGPCLTYWEFEILADWTAARLEAAFGRLVAHHDMLRMQVDRDGRQRIQAEVPALPIAAHDWSGLDTKAAEAALAALRGAMTQDLDPHAWPLIRLARSQGAGTTRLHMCFDLLIVDMPSLVLLLHQWAGLMQGLESLPARPTVSFRDYVLARAATEGSEAARDAAAYWQEAAEHLPSAPVLPGQKRSEAGAQAERPVQRLQETLDPATWQQLSALACKAGVTPAVALVGAFAETLAHWASDRRFTLNLTVMERAAPHPDVAGVVGDFTGSVLLGLDLATPLPFDRRAASVRDILAAHLAHARHGGVRVLRDLSRARRAPVLMPVVFTSMLGYAGVVGTEAAAGLQRMGRLVHGITRTPQTWLDCHVREESGGLAVAWDAAVGLFPDGLIRAMFSAYLAVLRHLGRPEAWQAPVADWLVRERTARRAICNATAAAPPKGLLHEGLLRQAILHPERMAVLAAGAQSRSYGEVAGLAMAVAARLGAMAPGRLVAVVMERGWEQAAAVTGVLIAGGAYLPLDPATPPARLAAILARGEVTTVLTTSATAATWRAELVVVPVELLAPHPPPTALPPPRAAAGDLAYVIFTSGSTGEPKGVMVEHAMALNTVADMNARHAVGPEDRVLALSALSFDLSVWDIFGVLGAGGALVLPRAGSIADPAHLAGLVARHRVTLWNSVPSFAQLLLEGSPQAAQLASLRLMMLSGDWIPPTLPERVRALCPAIALVGLGGATEAAIWSVEHRIGAPDPAWPSVPYGTPLRNQSCHVLDAAMADLPDCVAGELYIGGAGVARGYWRDPERTAERFVPHPRTGERLYRTGDLARYREGGVLEFLGRMDNQVKLGGHRVELGEVEAVLARHPRVGAAAAVAPIDRHGQRRLVAFCSKLPGQPPDAAELRQFAAASLPAYMIPAEIRCLTALPRSTQGKLDRMALEEWALEEWALEAGARKAGAMAAPRSVDAPQTDAIEARMLAIWRAVLGDPSLAPDCNLMERGATSFKVVEATARIVREIGPCSVTDVFEFPTARQLAARAARMAGPAAPADAAGTQPSLIAHRADRRRQFRDVLETSEA